MTGLKKIGLSILCRIFEWQVVRLRNRQEFIIIAVAGSLGKTSTKIALARLLENSGHSVRYQTGNYNVRLTVPLVVFGHQMPGLFNIAGWLKIVIANEKTIRRRFIFEYVIVELGTDAPGQIEEFAYLRPELGIVTGVAPEHMENFVDLDRVAREEFMVARFAKSLLINADDVNKKYLPKVPFKTYGLGEGCTYRVRRERQTEKGQDITISKAGDESYLSADIAYLGSQGMKIVAGSVAAADILGIAKKQVKQAVFELRPFSGRMQRLHGIKNSILLDDTYNSAPDSCLAALDVLIGFAAPQHIAILGSMNELGDYTEEAHQIVGKALRPEYLDLVVTIGKDAKRYLAPVAISNGCLAVSFDNPYEAGQYVSDHIKTGAIVLAKGSQNHVFAEEALKPLLKNPSDSEKLVRQSEYWLRKKQQQFPIVTL